MPQDRRHHKVRRNGGGGDVFIPVIIILLVITILSLIIAFAWQKWQDIYEHGKGLECGTIFKELDKPFLGKGGIRR